MLFVLWAFGYRRRAFHYAQSQKDLKTFFLKLLHNSKKCCYFAPQFLEE